MEPYVRFINSNDWRAEVDRMRRRMKGQLRPDEIMQEIEFDEFGNPIDPQQAQ